MTRKQKWIWGCVFAIVLSAPLWISFIGFFAWSPLNCWHYEVDIHTGRIRYTRYFLYAQVVQRVEESALSSALNTSDLAGVKPDWRRVHTLSPGVHNSPHYIFHSAMAQIRELDLCWKVGEFTPAAQRSSAKRVLELWQQSQDDDSVRPYLSALSDMKDRNASEHYRIDESDLPQL
jgi:hypothetical protein